MNRINDWLHIGKYRDTLDLPYLRFNKIGAMLQLAELIEQPEISALYLPVEDGQYLPHHLLTQGIEFVKIHHQVGKHILIACGAGISRSATFCMAALKEIEGITLLESYQLIQSKHDIALPHPELIKSLCDYYDEHPYDKIWRSIHFGET